MPMPRKLASRMKLEKYASSRTYAGIHRISAISRNRTRNDARNARAAERPSWVMPGSECNLFYGAFVSGFMDGLKRV